MDFNSGVGKAAHNKMHKQWWGSVLVCSLVFKLRLIT